MKDGFPRAARVALGDSQLRRNLGHATRTIRDKRARVVAEVADWEALRDAGAEIKARALRHLDVHLERLEESVQSAGGTVHWARDGAEACRIVADVVAVVPAALALRRGAHARPYLHRAVAVGDAQLVKLLLSFGANPNAIDDGGMTPLHRAASDGNAECAAALVAKGALNGVHFNSDDLDATFEQVRASGAEIVQEPTDQPWGTRDFAVRDPSGNLVRIDQPPAA